MTSSPLIKPKRQGMSNPFQWADGPKNDQASDFRVHPPCRASRIMRLDESQDFWRTIIRLAEHNCETGYRSHETESETLNRTHLYDAQ